ncbi:MAG: hypothetical protein JRJ59_09685 [Deltaproteobacteria bacterium]|nr:hypothetical protein [Deltaproteobacteria bacterium]
MAVDLQQPHILDRAGRYSSPRRKGDPLPIIYGDCTLGGFGGVWECPCIDTASYVYALAGHSVLSTANGNSVVVYDNNNQEISSADYTFNQAHDYESKGVIASLTFSSDQSDKEPISARAKGKDLDGSLIENPIEAAVDFLTDLVGLGQEEVDSTWRTRTRAYLDGLGVKLAGVLNQDVRPDQTLSQMLRLMASWWRSGSGRLVFRPHLGPGGLVNSDVVTFLTPKHFDGDRLKVVFDEEQICTRAAIKYGFNALSLDYEELDDGQTQAAADMEARYQGPYIRQFELPWVRQAATVAKLQEMVVGHYSRPPVVLTGRLRGFNHLHLEQGDVVSVSVDWLYDSDLQPLRNQFFRLTSVKAGLDPELGTDIEALDLGAFLTAALLADGGQTAGGSVQAGGQRDTNLYA